MHDFNLRVGGGYRMPRFHVTAAHDSPGKTAELEAQDGRKLLPIAFHNLPPGLRPEDNDAETPSSLEKLAGLLA